MDNHTTPESQEQFKYFVILQFYIAMRDRVEDNFDAVRFNFDGVDRSYEFQRREHALYLDWFGPVGGVGVVLPDVRGAPVGSR